MKNNILRIAIILVCSTHFCYSQDSFFVKIIAENKPVVKARIELKCSAQKKIALTNATGEVQFNNQQKNCPIIISALGCETKFANTLQEILDSNHTIYLQKKNSTLADVIITGQAKTILAQKSIYKINTISQQQIKQQAAQNLGDVLKNQLSSLIQQDNMLGSSINIQGIGGQNIKILVNGVPMNGRENGNIDLGQINLTNVERVEFVKGPMSVMYGTDALGGVINIITKQASSAKYKADIQSYIESINKINANIGLSFNKKNHAILANIGRNFFGGWGYLDSFNRAQLWKPKVQYVANVAYTFFGKNYKINYSPTIMYEYLLDKGTPTVDAFGAGATDIHYKTTRFSNTLSADIDINKTDKLFISNNFSVYNKISNTFYKDLVNLNEQQITTTGSQDTTKFNNYNFRAYYNTEKYKNISIMLGYEINLEDAYSLKLVNKTHQINDYAAYISAPIKIHKTITLQPALRYSYNTAYKAPLIPSINFKIELPKNIVLRTSYAKGFRAPSLKEMYLNFVDANHNIAGNDSLKAEKSNHVQLNIDAPLCTLNKNKTININANTFYNNIENQINLAALSVVKYKYANVSTFENIAQEINVSYNSAKINASVGTSFNTIFKADSNRKNLYTWELLAKANYVFGKYKTSCNMLYRYIHKQLVLNLAENNITTSYATLTPMQLADANIAQDFFKKKLNIQLGVKNIFNIQSLNLKGSTGDPHNTSGLQSISPSRSVFVGCKYVL